MLSRMILERCFSRHSSDRRMSHYENKPETTEEQLRLSHVIKLFKTSIEFPARSRPLFNTITSITSFFVFRSGQNRSVSFVIMAGFVKDFEHEEKREERVIKTRKTLQKKETGKEKNGERGKKRSKWQIRRTKMENYNSHSSAEQMTEKKVDLGGYSRASKMIRMAVGAAAIVPQKPRERHQTSLIAKKPTASNGSKFEPKELRPENIEFLSKNPVGSGSFGQCFLGRYRGIDVIVKQMTHNETSEDKERARRDLLHEAKVASTLGDYRWINSRSRTKMLTPQKI